MEEESRRKLKVGIGAAAVVLTIGALAGVTLKDGNFVQLGRPAYANSAFECSRVLDKSNTTPTADGFTYTSWEYSPNGQYKFVGRSAGGNDSIQLRSKDNSGIITQKTSLYCKQIDVNWNENTYDARVLDIYGKRVGDYDSPADLYNADDELIGSIAKASATSFVIPYAYSSIGVRSHDGAMYLNTINFSWTSYLDPVPAPEQSSEESISSSEETSTSTPSTEEVVNWVPADLGLNDTTNLTSVVIGYTTITLAKGSGSTAPRYWAADHSLRVYAGNTATITSTKQIKSMTSSPSITWIVDGGTMTLPKATITSIVLTYTND